MKLPATRAAVTAVVVDKRNDAEDLREETYTRGRAMTYPNVELNVKQRSDDVYENLLNRDNLALGAIERINIAHRILNQPELTMEAAKEIGSHGDEYILEYWNSSINYGGFWGPTKSLANQICCRRSGKRIRVYTKYLP